MYERIIEYILSQPWAILPEKAAAIRDLLRLRAAGLTLSQQDIEARIGDRREPPTGRREGAVAVIPVFGTIAHRMNLFTEISGGTSTEKLAAQIREFAADPAVEAIVLDVNSPGGGVFGLPELVEDIRLVAKKKPIVAVGNAWMASGAYWIGSAASELVVTPSGQVGAIGTFSMHEDWSKALEHDGVAVSLISAGRYKTEANPFEPLSVDARQAIQREVDYYYGLFTRDVARGRHVEVNAVRDGFGEGRMVNAKTALHLGMVDTIGTLDETIARLLKRSTTTVDIGARTPQQPLVESGMAQMNTEQTVEQPDPGPLGPDIMGDLRRRRLRLRSLELG